MGEEKQRERMNESLQLTHLLHRFPLYAFLLFFILFFSVIFVFVFANIFGVHVVWLDRCLACLLAFIANCGMDKGKNENWKFETIFYHLNAFRFQSMFVSMIQRYISSINEWMHG